MRKRVASHFSGGARRGAVRAAALDRLDRVVRRRDRGRGAAARAELHQAVQAALQHPAARRQVLPVHRDQPGRGLPARVLHARAPPPQARLLRAVLERQEGARHARPAPEGVPVPLLRGPEPGRRSGSPCLDYYIKRCEAPCVDYVAKEDYRGTIDGVVDFLSGRYREIERELEERMAAAAEAQEFEQAALVPQPPARGALAARAPAGGQRGGRNDRRVGVAVEGADANAQVFQVRDGVLSDRQSFYLTNEGERAAARGGRGVRCSSTTATATAIPPQIVVSREVGPRAALAEALGQRRGGPVEVRAAERGDKRRIVELAERNARWRSTRSASRTSGAGSGAWRRSRGCRRRSASTCRRCGSSASTSPTSWAPTTWPRWSCSRAARRRSPTTGASRPRAGGGRGGRLRRDERGARAPAGAVRGPARRSPHEPERDDSSPRCPT